MVHVTREGVTVIASSSTVSQPSFFFFCFFLNFFFWGHIWKGPSQPGQKIGDSQKTRNKIPTYIYLLDRLARIETGCPTYLGNRVGTPDLFKVRRRSNSRGSTIPSFVPAIEIPREVPKKKKIKKKK